MLLTFRSILALLLAWPLVAAAATATGSGEYLFGPETARNDACELARNKAKSDALSKVLGELVSNEEQLVCRSSTGGATTPDYGCEFNRITWSLIEGEIRSVSKETVVVEPRERAEACVVTLTAEVVAPSKKPDPNFNVRAQIDKTVVSVGDLVSLDIESTEPVHLVIFNWLPHQRNEVVRVIPGATDSGIDMLVLERGGSSRVKREFNFMTGWSEAYRKDKKLIDEWLIVIATRQPYKWLSQYELEGFREKLREIPVDQRRIVRKGYQLTP